LKTQHTSDSQDDHKEAATTPEKKCLALHEMTNVQILFSDFSPEVRIAEMQRRELIKAEEQHRDWGEVDFNWCEPLDMSEYWKRSQSNYKQEGYQKDRCRKRDVLPKAKKRKPAKTVGTSKAQKRKPAETVETSEDEAQQLNGVRDKKRLIYIQHLRTKHSMLPHNT
jgi:hypothetical protein